MSESVAIQPDPQEDGMTPRMVTMMIRVPSKHSDEHVAEEFNGCEVADWMGADLSSILVDCKTLSPREDEFFRNIPGAWKAKG